ncbi:ABC transporter ATP-binding protein [Phytoactinopolyspora mesophila]|uniref:ATP-binding cassette domain-containing protein n=1 Tax=Phytoactinopolyspora mesophila TaxID=2650750 RepID=A0A7K3M304_9ACTN|nr:ABC transporter ATP-binding protein [Phytoactinopolyspora mesophila]NDL57691.1 ATP-binding cassette domain-containing protein [Phytoactinopolyspora mesophila]
MAGLRFESVQKFFDKEPAVDRVDLEVADGEFVVLLGPSGCGKTTLLRCLAGLEKVDGGRVWIGGRDATSLQPRSRRIAMVFQNYAVFPHLKVVDNIAFGLRMQKMDKNTIDEQVRSAAELLHIEDFLDRYPAQLSGGQRQRVAVARAMATKADVLLMDEPLSNLDALLRMEMRAELKRIIQKLQLTTIYVTHDQVEALSMGDRIAVMNGGRIVQVDSPLEVYNNPADMFVGSFVGTPPMNFLEASMTSDGGRTVVEVSGGSFTYNGADADELTGRNLVLGIRAENIEVHSQPAPELVPAEVQVLEPLGSHNLLTVRTGADTLKVSAPAESFPAPGSDIWLKIDPERVRWMDRSTRQAITWRPVEAQPHPA